MTKAKKKAKKKLPKKKIAPCKNRLKCPSCGNAEKGHFSFVELVPSARAIHGFRKGVLVIDTESTEYTEFGDQQKICCENCAHEWPLDRRIDYMDSYEWEWLKEKGEVNDR